MIQSGELDFSFDNSYDDSECVHMYNGNEVKQIININREFNYEDVVVLIHEFIHYVNGKKHSKNRYYLSEFLSIYFELYAVSYLIKKGINKDEVDYFSRFKSARRHAAIFSQYEIVLLAFIKFGNIDESTVSFLQKYVLNIKKEVFEKEATNLCKNLSIVEEDNKERIKEDSSVKGRVLSEEFITVDYRYVLGTMLAIYAREYVSLEVIVNLNNHINDYDDKSIYDICLGIGIDLNAQNFRKKLFFAMDEYINDMQSENKKSI